MGKRMPKDLGISGAARSETRARKFVMPSAAETDARHTARLEHLPAEALRPHALQPAERHARENILELTESIRSLGLQDPPLVRRLPDGTEEILAGHRRIHSWRLLAEAGEVDARIPAYVRTDVTDRDAAYIIAAEYAHRREYSFLHTADVVGTAAAFRASELDREPTLEELADILPWGKSSIGAYRAIHRARQEPELEAHFQRLERPDISLLYKLLSDDDFSRRRDALGAYARSGKAAARTVLKRGRTGRPPRVVKRTNRKDRSGYTLTLRYRVTMSQSEADEAAAALRDSLRDIEKLLEDAAEEARA